MYRFLLRPRWIVSHLLVVSLVITMVNLGLWQLRRLDSRQAVNELIRERSLGSPEPFADVVAAIPSLAEGGLDDGDSVNYRSVVVGGTYEPAAEFTVLSRTLAGAAGRWVVTPLRTDDGPVVLVNRGFVPQSIGDVDPPIAGVEPPAGRVTVSGWVRRTEVPEGLQVDDSAVDDSQFARVDIRRVADISGLDLAPVYVQLGAQSPATRSEMITPVPLPERTDGPHLAYAVQWAIFSLIAIGGYPLIIRRVASDAGRATPEDTP